MLAPCLLGDAAGHVIISNWVYDFSLAVGVYSMGWKGVLFAPMLVCTGELLFELRFELLFHS